MAVAIIMPRQGQSVESCVITTWEKKVGDAVAVGDILFTYETDKSSFEEKSTVAGTLLAIFAEEGEDVPCLENVCVIGNAGEDISEFTKGAQAPAEAPAQAAPAAAQAVSAPAAVAEIPAGVTAVIMPRQGQSVESCVITTWEKKVGDAVKSGDILFTYETDKSSFEEKATVEGTLLAILAEEGEDVPCLDNVCLIGPSGTDVSAFVNAASQVQSTDAPVAQATPVAAPVAIQATSSEVNVEKISPRAKNLAVKTNADLLKAVPTGPYGRIIERDVQTLLDKGFTVSGAAMGQYTNAVEGSGANGRVVLADLNAKAPEAQAPAAAVAAPAAAYVDEKLTNMRKVIAKAMHNSLSTMAQLTLNTSFDATKLQACRAALKANAEKMGLAKITLNDMVLFAVSRTLLNHRAVNAHFLDDTMRYFTNANIGIAVDTERGLLVPTVFAADKLSLNQLSKAAKVVISEAQKGTISPDNLKGASFTVTNLGAMGIESFTPVINPPQTCILGVNNITKKIKEVDGEDVIYPAMGLSLTFDHRALDGAPAAKFLQELCYNLENFDLLMAL